MGGPHLEVADVFRAHGDAYRRAHALSEVQLKAMRAIEICRTSVLGGHLDVCPNCGEQRPSYNSCRNRHCPKCQALRQARWIAQRQTRILPVRHFHVVFTAPAQLRPLAAGPARRRFFELLFEAVAATLLELAKDPKRLGGQPAITAVLHTWTRKLELHPHVHCVVSAGGLDGDRWRDARPNHLFPVKVMGALFRGKLLAAIEQARARGEIDLPSWREPRGFARFKDALYKTGWVVYAKRPFGGAAQVFQYLGRYTHRIALSNQRMVSMEGTQVRFITRGGHTETLQADEFVRRYLQHVLPERFVKIRHFGLLAPCNVGGKLERARRLLPPRRPHPPLAAPKLLCPLIAMYLALARPAPATLDWRTRLLLLTGLDPLRCRCCGYLMERKPLPRAPPELRDTS